MCIFQAGASISSDSFWQSTLNDINDFRSAMNYYRELFRSLSTCTGQQCSCVGPFSYGLNYTYYFLNERNFNDLIRLCEPVKLKYKPRTIEQVNNDQYSHSFDLSTPTLANFVLNYDWASLYSIGYYDAVQQCLLSKNEQERIELEKECSEKFPNNNDLIIKCYYKELDCPIEVKNYAVTANIIFLPDPKYENFYDHVTYLTGASIRLNSSFSIVVLPLLISLIFYKFTF